MTDTMRWGVLGASSFARTSMAPAIHAARGAELAALATSDAAKAGPFRDFAPGLVVYEDYDALLADPGIDAIYVPLPNHLHVEWTIKALDAGKHVLCEKPIAMEEADFDRLIAARDRSGKLAAEAFMIVHHPQWQAARDIVAEGRLGPLVHAEAAFSYNNPDPDNVRNKAGMGGGGLRDIGVYTMGSVRFATGEEPTRLTAWAEMEHDYDTFAEVNARFPSFSYHMIVSMRAAARQVVTFHGRDGLMTLTAPFNPGIYDQAEIVLETARQRREVLRWPHENQYVLQVESFCNSASRGAAYPWPLERARGTQGMIDWAFRAAGAG